MIRKISMILCIIFILSAAGCVSEPRTVAPPQNETVGGGASACAPEYAYYIQSAANGLAVRKAASVRSDKLGTLDRGDMLILVGSVNGWYETVYRERTAYVCADYCNVFKIEAADEAIERVLTFAASLSGYPYVWGSERYHWNGVLNKNFVNGEFDCSAFVQYVYYVKADVILGTTTREQVVQGNRVGEGDLRRGDLMFFTNSARRNNSGIERVGHVGIYLGENYILHTSCDYAVIEPISASRRENYITARRVL